MYGIYSQVKSVLIQDVVWFMICYEFTCFIYALRDVYCHSDMDGCLWTDLGKAIIGSIFFCGSSVRARYLSRVSQSIMGLAVIPFDLTKN